ncbi:MAG: hypothetical protein GXP42_04260 [Chloroflexi bacterium]|nr:hypothetical protein [Chloroflexota bacterium]
MRDRLALLFFFVFLGVIVIALPDDFELSGIGALPPFLLVLGMAAGSAFLAEKVSNWLVQRRKERRLARALAALSMSLEEALAEAPYDYDHWQGEDGYRIFDVRVQEGYVGFASSPSDAELWIVERYLADKMRDGSLRTQ